jgi:hypothetical protein
MPLFQPSQVAVHEPTQFLVQLLAQVALQSAAWPLPPSAMLKPKTPNVGMISFPADKKKSRLPMR